MSVGLVISRPNEDAATTDPKKLSYSSDFLSPKIYSQGSLTFDFANNATASTINVAHGLGFAPAYDLYAEIRNSNELFKHESQRAFFSTIGISRDIITDTDSYNLKATMNRDSSLGAAKYRGYYFIYMDLPLGDLTKKYKQEKTGLKISPPGVDAEKAGDVQLSYNSAYPTLEIFGIFDFSIALSTTVNEVRISHGLGYWPAFEIGLVVPQGSSLKHATLPFIISSAAGVYGFCTSDEIIIRGILASGSATVQGKVIVFYNRVG